MTQSRGEPLNRFTNNEENRFRACSSWQGSLGRTLLSRTGRAGAPQPVAVGRGSPFFQKGLYLSMNHHHHHHHPRLLGMGYVGVYIIYYNIYIYYSYKLYTQPCPWFESTGPTRIRSTADLRRSPESPWQLGRRPLQVTALHSDGCIGTWI